MPLLFVPFFEPKLALLPAITAVWEALRGKRERISYIVLALALITLTVNFSQFRGQTIFNPDYEAEQQVLEKINLYPTVLMARVFQNKARIYLDKISSNLFALTDPNNYFFGFHPREIVVENQNLKKFPFVSIIFFLLGLYFVNKYKYRSFILVLLLASLLSLSILKNFDRTDFIIWIPLGLLVAHGIEVIEGKPLQKLLFAVFVVVTFVQFLRLFFE